MASRKQAAGCIARNVSIAACQARNAVGCKANEEAKNTRNTAVARSQMNTVRFLPLSINLPMNHVNTPQVKACSRYLRFHLPGLLAAPSMDSTSSNQQASYMNDPTAGTGNTVVFCREIHANNGEVLQCLPQ